MELVHAILQYKLKDLSKDQWLLILQRDNLTGRHWQKNRAPPVGPPSPQKTVNAIKLQHPTTHLQ